MSYPPDAAITRTMITTPYRIALEGRVCETCDTKGCHRPATWEIECRGAGVSGHLIYSCDEHCPDPAILSPQDEMRRLVENRKVD